MNNVNTYPLSDFSDYEVMISSILDLHDQKLLLKLYMPIVGDKVISLYQTLYSLVPEGAYESEIDKHEKIIRLMHLRSITKFMDIRNKLEAIGLLNVYYKDGLYVYSLKKPLDAESFFNNIELSTLLEYQLGHDEYENTYLEFMMRKLDVNKFENITHCFDEIYSIEPSENIYLSQASFNNINNGIVIDNKTFDYNRFMILLSANDVIQNEYFSDEKFINQVKRYSFLYQLTPEEMKDVIILSINENKEVLYDEIPRNARRKYDEKGQKLGVVPKPIVKASSSIDDKLVRYLELASPNEFVKNKSGIALTSTEIDMFDRLLRDTNIGVGVLNVLIGYILEKEDLNGEIPSYNYFLKIINTWKRASVKSTSDAISYVSNKDKSSKNRSLRKTQKGVPDWYGEYVNKQSKKSEVASPISHDKTKLDDIDLEELKNFFNPNNKE